MTSNIIQLSFEFHLGSPTYSNIKLVLLILQTMQKRPVAREVTFLMASPSQRTTRRIPRGMWRAFGTAPWTWKHLLDVDILGKHHEIKPYKPCQRGVKHPKDGDLMTKNIEHGIYWVWVKKNGIWLLWASTSCGRQRDADLKIAWSFLQKICNYIICP